MNADSKTRRIPPRDIVIISLIREHVAASRDLSASVRPLQRLSLNLFKENSNKHFATGPSGNMGQKTFTFRRLTISTFVVRSVTIAAYPPGVLYPLGGFVGVVWREAPPLRTLSSGSESPN